MLTVQKETLKKHTRNLYSPHKRKYQIMKILSENHTHANRDHAYIRDHTLTPRALENSMQYWCWYFNITLISRVSFPRVKRTSGGGRSVEKSTLGQLLLGDGLARGERSSRLIKECDSLVRATLVSWFKIICNYCIDNNACTIPNHYSKTSLLIVT